MKIGKTFTFDAAHRLQNHDGKCRNLHGHTYRVEVSIESGPDWTTFPQSLSRDPDVGMLMDFSKLKEWWRPVETMLDHVTILEDSDPLIGALSSVGRQGTATTTFPWPPTAENLAWWIQRDLASWLTRHTALIEPAVRVKVYETPTSWAEAS